MTKVPDLIGIKDRKYIDHTGTHRLRGPADVMRYAGLVRCCDPADFGPHRMLTDAQRKIFYKIPDDLRSRWRSTSLRSSRRRIRTRATHAPRPASRSFRRERCATCHAPPLYTNNKLTLAPGY